MQVHTNVGRYDNYSGCLICVEFELNKYTMGIFIQFNLNVRVSGVRVHYDCR